MFCTWFYRQLIFIIRHNWFYYSLGGNCSWGTLLQSPKASFVYKWIRIIILLITFKSLSISCSSSPSFSLIALRQFHLCSSIDLWTSQQIIKYLLIDNYSDIVKTATASSLYLGIIILHAYLSWQFHWGFPFLSFFVEKRGLQSHCIHSFSWQKGEFIVARVVKSAPKRFRIPIKVG